MPNGVMVLHPSRTLNTYQAALAFQEAGCLTSFETGFYSKLPSSFIWLLERLPEELRFQIERELRRRIQLGLRNDLIHCHLGWDLVFSIISRLKWNPTWAEKVMYWRNDRFGKAVARIIRRRRPAAVYGYETSSFEAFQACDAVGSKKILEHVSGHYETTRQTMEEERRIHPEFSEDLKFTHTEHRRSQWLRESQMADRLVVPSMFVAHTLVAIGIPQDRITVVPYGVDTERFKPRLEPRPPGPFRILYAGRIHPMKGVIYLLEAIKQLKLADVELILLGSGDMSGKGWNPYKGLFRHVPRVPYHEMPPLYRSADLFVFPSLHEGSALVTYEAMASGLPVITTENAGSVVRNGEEGWIVPIRDVEALKQKISLMISDRELRESMSAKARQRAEQFSWAAYRQNLIGGLNRLL